MQLGVEPPRSEIFRAASRQRMSIVDMIGLVTACAIFFGGLRVAGVYGAALGGFALQAAIGRMRQRNDWQLGAFYGSLTCIATLTITWFIDSTFISNQSSSAGQTSRTPWLTYFLHQPGEGPFVLPLLMCFALAFTVAFFLPRDSGQTKVDLIAVAVLSIGGTIVTTFIAIGCVAVSR